MDNMYELLMSLPLFSGVSKERMLEIVGKTKFHFLKYLTNEPIVRAGEQCTHMKFVISGSARSSITNRDGRFTVAQTIDAPGMIAPEFIFGRVTIYPCNVTALEPTGILQIDKADFMKILNSDPIFLINFLNILSMNAQKAVDGVLAVATGNLEERIAFWIVALTQRGAKDITLCCRQRDLYALFGVQRSSFISTLDSMKAKGIIDYTSSEIRISDRTALVKILLTHVE